MRLLCFLLLIYLAAGIYLYCEDMRLDRYRDEEIRVLQTKVEELQLIGAGRIRVPEYDEMPGMASCRIKY